MATLHLDFYKGSESCGGNIEEWKTYLKKYGGNVGADLKDTDFASLSCNERNLLSWYEFAPEASVLEVGTGFGAVTGVLCEKCRSVTVAEPSRERAEYLCALYKERNHLDIFAGRFCDIQFAQRFDYILLHGIEKYAAAAASVGEFLDQLHSLLKPEGKLLLTAENRFGVSCGKVAGAAVGAPIPFACGEEEASSAGAFSREELKQLLARSGYPYTDFYYLYPDDRMPGAIFSDRRLPQLWEADRLLHPHFSSFIQQIVANGVFPFFAPVFFIEAAGQPPQAQRKLNAAFFRCAYKEEFRVGTAFYSDGTVLTFPAVKQAQTHIQDVHNNYLRLLTSGIRILDEKLTDRGIAAHSMDLPTLEQVLYHAVQSGETEVFFLWLDRFFENILRAGRATFGDIDTVLERGYPGMMFSNCFTEGDSLIFFDQEWTVENIPAGYLLSRALKQFFLAFPNRELEERTYLHFGLDSVHLEEYESAEQVFEGFILDAAVSRVFRGDACRQEEQENSENVPEQKTQELQVPEQKKQEAQYREALARIREIENDPARLGKKRIAKAFFKAFAPSFVLRAARSVRRFCRGRKDAGFHWRSEYDRWIKRGTVCGSTDKKPECEPLISILVPLYNTDKKMLEEMITSCLKQTYGNFELCLADASDQAHGYVYETAAAFAAKDARIKLKKLEQNLGIAGNTNACRTMASGEYLALLDHDDRLTENALSAVVKAIADHHPDVLYSDEDHLKNGRRTLPFFKPDFNRDLLYSQMYICHFLVFRTELFDQVGQMQELYSGSQDYDLMLRFTEYTQKIYHIPDVLYSWRETESSTSANPEAKPYAHEAGRKALDAHLKRRYGSFAYAEDSAYLFVYDARFDTLKDRPLVSIIIPTKDHASDLKTCVESILQKSTYQNFEILILDNRSSEEATFSCFQDLQKQDGRIRIVEAPFAFNWSKLNNLGIQNSRGEVLIFLNNDTAVNSPDWIERLAENALRPDIGVVGALLLYPDETIQHAGVVVGMRGWADHVYKGQPLRHAADMFVSPMVNRDVLAVTGACMAVSRKTLQKIGCFDESFIVCGSDVELCLRAGKHGLGVLYNARVRLYHMESKSRNTAEIPSIDFVRSEEAYQEYLKNGDPFYNKNLDSNSTKPRIKL